MKAMLASDLSFVFGPFRLVPNKQLLLNEGRRIKLGGRAFDLLHLLVTRAGEEITKTELIAFAWPKVIVDEQNLKVNINGIRRALQDTFPNTTYIATIVGTGYQFIAEVRSEATQTLDPATYLRTCCSIVAEEIARSGFTESAKGAAIRRINARFHYVNPTGIADIVTSSVDGLFKEFSTTFGCRFDELVSVVPAPCLRLPRVEVEGKAD